MSALTEVRVPASSANLGPGFDTLGLALGIYLHCRFRIAAEDVVRVSGRDTESIPAESKNLILKTAREVAEAQGRELPPVYLEIENEIPVGKGLGSSAAALVVGVVLADRVLGMSWDEHRLLDEAARIEGHPDNVSAAVLGSVTTAAIGADGVTRAVRLEVPRAFSVAVVCPDFELSTLRMRDALPDSYSREDAIFNIQRATLLVAALLEGDRDAFPVAFEDRLHQPYRSGYVPGLDAILSLRVPGLLGCALSGAGPAVLVLYETGREDAVRAVAREFEKAGCQTEVMFPHLDRTGLVVKNMAQRR
ncbi:MAG: homoserine kinase [Bryobacterales bacterium]|nr:homoserine kinase [Bryobacterales bacterium]